jgi:hypothetical protein
MTPQPAYTPRTQDRPSPVSDLIQRHRIELAKVWERHIRELLEGRAS